MLDRLIAKSPFATVVTAALEESRRRGDRRLGTEHLLLGLLHDPDCARALGVDLETPAPPSTGSTGPPCAALGIEVEGLRPAQVPVRGGKPDPGGADVRRARGGQRGDPRDAAAEGPAASWCACC